MMIKDDNNLPKKNQPVGQKNMDTSMKDNPLTKIIIFCKQYAESISTGRKTNRPKPPANVYTIIENNHRINNKTKSVMKTHIVYYHQRKITNLTNQKP